MDLSREEAEEIFPEGRESPIDDADVEPWMLITADEQGWLIMIDDEEWHLSPHQTASFTGDNTIWSFLSDRESAKDWLNRNV